MPVRKKFYFHNWLVCFTMLNKFLVDQNCSTFSVCKAKLVLAIFSSMIYYRVVLFSVGIVNINIFPVDRMATSTLTSMKCTRHPLSILPRPLNIGALCWKNLVHIYRNPGLLLFQFLVPVFQVALFSLAIGGNLKGIHVAYVNSDTVPEWINLSFICNDTSYDGGLVGYSNLGQVFVDQLKYTDLVTVSPLLHAHSLCCCCAHFSRKITTTTTTNEQWVSIISTCMLIFHPSGCEK